MFENFWGNAHVTEALEQMLAQDRLAQTLLFSGPEGVGKATLARRLGARLLGHAEQIEQDDLQPAEQPARSSPTAKNGRPRSATTIRCSSPRTPISSPSRRMARCARSPSRRRACSRSARPSCRTTARRRVFLIDHVDRANEQAANSLLKTLEEPPPHLILIMTAENAYDLLPTIRSRAVPFQFAPLAARGNARQFVRARGLDQPERRVALAAGSPGVAVSLDLETYDKRRAAMLALLKVAAGAAPFGDWMPVSEAIGRSQEREAGCCI